MALAAAGQSRRVGLTVTNFLLAAHVVAGSDMLYTTARELILGLAPTLDLVVREAPVDLPEVRVAALWSERLNADRGHRWFRSHVIAAVMAALLDP